MAFSITELTVIQDIENSIDIQISSQFDNEKADAEITAYIDLDKDISMEIIHFLVMKYKMKGWVIRYEENVCISQGETLFLHFTPSSNIEGPDDSKKN